MIRILLIDGELVLAEELRAAFSEVEGLALVLGSGREQLSAELAAHRPDVILLDARSELVTDSISIWQYVAPLSRVVLWARSVSPEFAFQAIRLGVRGVLLKTASIATVLRCLTSVSKGEIWFDKALFDDVTQPSRESEVLKLLALGLTNKQGATAMNIPEGMVKVYLIRFS